jgi:hypothetical protein
LRSFSFDWPLKLNCGNGLARGKLNLHFAPLHIFQIVNNQPADVSADTNGAPVRAERNGGHHFPLRERHLLVGAGVLRIIGVYIYLFYFFTLCDIIKVDPAVDTTGGE